MLMDKLGNKTHLMINTTKNITKSKLNLEGLKDI